MNILNNNPVDEKTLPLLKKMVEGGIIGNKDVVDCMASPDTLVKKITCSYLEKRCLKNTDLCLLTANLILKDCSNPNPSIRSLSIITLACLPDFEDNSIRIISSSLGDHSELVRRAAVLACVMLHKNSKEIVIQSGLADLLYQNIRDSDPIVSTFCLLSLEHILKSEGGVVINKGIAHYLINRIQDYSNFSSSYIFSILLRYTPKSEEEIFLLLNALDDCLLSTSISVLIPATKLFLRLTKDYPHLKKDVFNTIKTPVCKLLNRNKTEVNYSLLMFLYQHKDYLKDSFASEYKDFLLKLKDPIYLKKIKLKIIPYICNEENVKFLVHEIRPYCSEYKCYKEAIKCLTVFGINFQEHVKDEVSQTLIPLLAAPSDKVVIDAIKCFLFTRTKTIPDQIYKHIIEAINRPSIQNSCPDIILEILGSLCDVIDNVANYLEQLANRTETFHEYTHCKLLKISAWVFHKRPAQMQIILSGILSTAFKSDNVKIKDTAAYVYAILEEPNAGSFELLRPCFAINE